MAVYDLRPSFFGCCRFYRNDNLGWNQRGSLSYLVWAASALWALLIHLQIVGQKRAEPTQASLILSLETVFAAVGGYFLLQELLSSWELLGCVLMMIGMVVAQIPWLNWRSGIKSVLRLEKAEIK